MRHIRKLHVLAAAGAVALMIGVAVPSQAAVATTSRTIVTKMRYGGIDAAAAKRQGFEVQTVNGRTVPVPVTDEAKRKWAEAQAESPGAIRPDNTVTGECGSSSVTAIYNGNNTVKVATSYTVDLPAVDHNWHVDESLVATGTVVHTFDFTGLSTGRNTWVGDPQVSPIINDTFEGGDAQVTLGSFAILVGGFVCYSGGPIDYF